MTNEKQQKGQPIRTCIVSREKLPKNELVRLVRVGEEGNYKVEVDLRSKKKGRGANIKPDLSVLEEAFTRKSIERALQLGRSLSAEEQSQLRFDFEAAIEEKRFRPRNERVKLKISRAEFQEKLGD